ncbi:type IV pilin protein [Acinetobacter silvestris]|uniref:Pilin n=1 Tax=Acinetobacter silvestris TaxID=1977882 RepID=A0A1Y3CMP0_9GAMM|nr:type IV pilin protein [Acinetobacter silvestris]OTG67143.1 pilin [Acinetobacter silvestris]
MDQINPEFSSSIVQSTYLKVSGLKKAQQGFTLVELMVVVVIITIFAVIAIPSYQEYVRRNQASAAEQEIQKIAEQLERFRAKNFTYRCFDPKYLYGGTISINGSNRCKNDDPLVEVNLPQGATGTNIKYVITIMDLQDTSKKLTDDAALGRSYAIKALSKDANKNYTYLLTSVGLRCKNKTSANVAYTDCGAPTNGMESW